MVQAQDAGQSALGKGLRSVLADESPETALAALPDDLRTHILEELNDQT
jgi:hypothetical protein